MGLSKQVVDVAPEMIKIPLADGSHLIYYLAAQLRDEGGIHVLLEEQVAEEKSLDVCLNVGVTHIFVLDLGEVSSWSDIGEDSRKVPSLEDSIPEGPDKLQVDCSPEVLEVLDDSSADLVVFGILGAFQDLKVIKHGFDGES